MAPIVPSPSNGCDQVAKGVISPEGAMKTIWKSDVFGLAEEIRLMWGVVALTERKRDRQAGR